MDAGQDENSTEPSTQPLAVGAEPSIADSVPTQPTAPEVPQPPPTPKTIFDVIYEAGDVNIPKQRIAADIRTFIKESGLENKYEFVFLYDDRSQISRYTSNRIYSAVTDNSHSPNTHLFLLLHTGGGKVEPAYLISKCCKKSAPRFVVAVPRFAKSAGTLIALGADEIHMGIISELGPIDPQIGDPQGSLKTGQ